MSIQINQDLCAGCGVCVDVCPVKAIQLVNYWAEVDEDLCMQCGACVDACPNGAITAISVPAYSVPIVAQPAVAPHIIPIPAQSKRPEIATPAHGLVPLASETLVFLRREVAPRLVDVLVTALERRLTRPRTTTPATVSTSIRVTPKKSHGIRRQARYRGGRNGKW